MDWVGFAMEKMKDEDSCEADYCEEALEEFKRKQGQRWKAAVAAAKIAEAAETARTTETAGTTGTVVVAAKTTGRDAALI